MFCHLEFITQVPKPQVATENVMNGEIFKFAAAIFQLCAWMNCAGELINAALLWQK